MSDLKEDIRTEMDEFKDTHSAKIDLFIGELKDAYMSVFEKVGCLTTEDRFREVESIVQRLKNLSNLPGKIHEIKNSRILTEAIHRQYSSNPGISIEKINENFDIILLNPPQTAGKKLCFKLIEDAKSHLLQNGSLQLVARHNKGGKELSKKMLEVFGNVKDIAKSSGYRIYISKNSGKNL